MYGGRVLPLAAPLTLVNWGDGVTFGVIALIAFIGLLLAARGAHLRLTDARDRVRPAGLTARADTERGGRSQEARP